MLHRRHPSVLAMTAACLLAAAAGRASDPPPNTLTEAERAAGWRLLFDGKTTSGWRGFKKPDFPAQGWAVADGCLKKVATGTGDSLGSGDIVTTDTFGDFDLRFEWRIAKGGNSGVKYFVTEERSGPIAHEYQVLDDAGHPDAKVGSHRQSAAFYDVLPPSATAKKLKPVGEFNQSRVLVRGPHVEHWLNGAKVLEYELGSPELKAAIAKSKFKDVAGFGTKIDGRILLQDHGDEVCYRNVKIQARPR
jgi:3-keto-disaccharide hydrolase